MKNMGLFFCPNCHISCAALHFILRCNICFYRFIFSIHPPTFQAFLILFELVLPSSCKHQPRFSNCLGQHSLTTESSNNSSRNPNTPTQNTTLPFRSKPPLTIPPSIQRNVPRLRALPTTATNLSTRQNSHTEKTSSTRVQR